MKKLYRDCSPHVGDVLEVVDTVCKWVIARVILVLNRSLFLVYFEGKFQFNFFLFACFVFKTSTKY